MMKRLEQVAALVVAAGLALVSYWLFFSWAQGGRVQRSAPPPRSADQSESGDRSTPSIPSASSSSPSP